MRQEELDKILKDHKEWLVDRKKGKRAYLRGANLYEAYLRGANLCGANLCGADLYGADLRGANLRGANLCGADLYGADLYGADLYGADLYGADLRGAKGVLTFIGEHHQIIYYRHNDQYRAQIGCKDLPIEEWIENFEEIGISEDYPKESIKLYGEVLKLFSTYSLEGV